MSVHAKKSAFETPRNLKVIARLQKRYELVHGEMCFERCVSVLIDVKFLGHLASTVEAYQKLSSTMFSLCGRFALVVDELW